MAVDLLFKGAPLTEPPINLTFGAEDDAPTPDTRTLNGLGRMSALRGRGTISRVQVLNGVGKMSAMRGSGAMIYQSRTSRPLVNRTDQKFQQAITVVHRVDNFYAAAQPVAIEVISRWQKFLPVHSQVVQRWQKSDKVRNSTTSRWQDFIPLSAETRDRFQQSLQIRNGYTTRWQDALQLPLLPTVGRFQQALKRRRETVSKWQQAIDMQVGVHQGFKHARRFDFSRTSRYQDAIVPPPGIRVRPPIPGPDPCYVPPAADAVHLMFSQGPASPSLLLFTCETHGPGPNPGDTIVVPIQKVYIVINSASLKRVDDNTPIHSLDLSVALDVDSWTWTFNGTLPTTELDKVMPDMSGDPVIVQTTINGQAIRLVVESISRARTFNQATIAVSGRGINALLDAPYAPIMNFGNESERSAEQLLGDILSFNGVALPDWSVDFTEMDDWTVPAGVWSYQGSHIGALNDVIGAAGGYLQPHPWEKTMYARHRYPMTPWSWAANVTPDYELPADVTTNEGIEWLDKARYNRVFVSGVRQGILGQVTRQGTAGDLVAPMVTHSLITSPVAARQRGRVVISDVGRQAMVSLRLPVLPLTGLITPGKFVNYVDGATERLGIVRSTSVSVAMPEIFQTLVVETHVSP